MPLPLDPASLLVGAAAGALIAVAALRLGERKARSDLERERTLLAEQLKGELRAVSAEALNTSTQSFLDLARTQFDGIATAAKGDIGLLIDPVKQSLEKVQQQIQEVERERAGAYGKLSAQVEEMAKTHLRLTLETQRLVSAMRSPGARGRWGEVQLRRVIEMAGMLAHVDFVEQQSASDEDGRLRPDVLVRLPGGGTIVIDSKVPFEHYLDAVSTEGEEAQRQEALLRHARLVRRHIADLSAKSYWQRFQPSPELVVMFMPDEGFFSAALRADPALVETGMESHVVPATPTTLIALLRAVAFGWRQEALARNAQAISEQGAELYRRLAKFGEHFQKIGKGLTSAMNGYNDAVGSLERQVLPSARRFRELKAVPSNSEMPEPAPLEILPRPLVAPELTGPSAGIADAAD